MINEDIAKSMLEEFDGCDSDNPGSPECPAVWLFGIEHGQELEDARNTLEVPSVDDSYSIKTQLGPRYGFNKKAFKLLAAMKGYPVETYREFANDQQPFVRGRNGDIKNNHLYFKGNLYPYACKNVGEWSDIVKKEIGIADKEEYRQWCRDHRLPAIMQWVDRYQPKIFIGVGITCRDEFSLAVFGKVVDFKKEIITDKKIDRPIFYFSEESKKLVVVPHFSGRYGLRSDVLLQEAGKFIAGL